MKSTLVMAVVAALGMSALALPADAKMHRERDFFGFDDGPFGMHCMRFGHSRHCNDAFFENRVNCGEARYRVAAAGFTKIVTKNCAGSTYRFTGNKKGARYLITVNGRSGFMSARKL